MAIFDFLKEIPLSAVLREKLKDIEADLAKVKGENQKLVEASGEKDKLILALSEQVQTLTARLSPPAPQRLSELEEKALQVLASHDGSSDQDIAKLLKVGHQVAAYHLEELRRRNFVSTTHTAGSEWGDEPRTLWHLEHSAREYLIKNNLVQ